MFKITNEILKIVLLNTFKRAVKQMWKVEKPDELFFKKILWIIFTSGGWYSFKK